MSEIIRGANFSRCKRYRYALARTWDTNKPQLMIIGLNPSTADHKQDDPTIRRCINFAKNWGYGSVVIANLFAFRATYPKELLASEEPIGPANDRWLKRLASQSDLILAAWGNDGSFQNRSSIIRKRFKNLYCLEINASGEPAHPLYQPNSAKHKPYSVTDGSPQ